jgi:predicted PurR-regulated permease PerM
VNWKRLRGCLGVFLVFVFGVIVGAAMVGAGVWHEIGQIIERGPDAVVSKVAKRLKDELKLDDDQQRMLAQITTETQIKLRTIQLKNQPDVDATLTEAADKVRAILNGQQRAKFEKIIGRVQTKWRDPAKTATPAPQ